MFQTLCPECDYAIPFSSQPRAGDRIVCQSCSSTLTVILGNPITLDWAFVEPIDKAWDKLEQKPPAEGKYTGIVSE